MSEKEFYTYEPHQGHGLLHDPFNSIIAPRPIGWISTISAEGVPNLAPYSFFNAFNYNPPIIGFSSIGVKDTLKNSRETKEFVWNLVTRPLADQMNLSSTEFDRNIDEFEAVMLQKLPSLFIRPLRVAASPVQFECRVTQIVQLRSFDEQPIETWLTLGEVVAIHIEKKLVKDGVYHTAAAGPVQRGGGKGFYSEITESSMFNMRRPEK